MKPAQRFEGVIHDRVDCPDVGALFAVTVIGPEPGGPGTVSLDARGRCIDMGLRLSRGQAKRLGELLIQAADDGQTAQEVRTKPLTRIKGDLFVTLVRNPDDSSFGIGETIRFIGTVGEDLYESLDGKTQGYVSGENVRPAVRS